MSDIAIRATSNNATTATPKRQTREEYAAELKQSWGVPDNYECKLPPAHLPPAPPPPPTDPIGSFFHWLGEATASPAEKAIAARNRQLEEALYRNRDEVNVLDAVRTCALDFHRGPRKP